ncbi:hypothetical protein evm_013956 [Chilo suppressalis]|nr:hypothetical protein evm_013956 [Chilo suppressalis]
MLEMGICKPSKKPMGQPLHPINVPTAEAQAFPMDGIGRLGHDPPRGPSADWRVLTTADAAETNGLTLQPADLAALYAESDPLAPIIFVLSTGTDPAADLLKFADKMKMGKRFESISLGQGQGPLAENMMRIGCDFGNWVFFQNCHLSPSWMPVLELNVEHIQPELVHKDFRLWLTSTPSPQFPVALLQNGYKMTVEPPRGIKANLLKAYMNQVPDFMDYFNSNDSKVPNFKWLLFSLCLFHGVVLERRKFGPLGFNIPYEFTDGDLRICISQLHMFLTEYTEVPLKMLTYTAGHINYGGRVTDDWDRRCLLCLLADYYSTSVLSDRFMFDESGAYKQPIKVPIAGAQAFLMHGIGILGRDPLRGPSVDRWVLTTADAAGTNGLMCLLKLGPEHDIIYIPI